MGDYFLSLEAAAGVEAGLDAAGVLLDALLLDDALLDEDELLDDELEEDDESPSFFVELYRSEYQPPPLRTKLERLTTLVSEPSAPQAVQAAGVGSEIFCSTSIIFPQLWQAYS
ncbi:hypothetical protein SAMN05443572_103502 [Myxococcus fulvus]|uniref:Uncharacterized protein n=1 Tax=Myxococcus fulvus TaxID=33 RepID=A0ABY1CA55_MYXFU|nr:hypothetical protein SAMN05443572_103502 [Myxococcus fulvus]